ncbi:PDZ/DHR/GLGF domain protein (plasmid) [Stanieria cyanosphaera PCC 7437]|uniref:PDZ/DHR/GLGF domain protein n=1 Tax=Stanieria cyanosphaera (strain ATCC 29371 / PCC 7437) TaxID=111780 RepID=K9Y1M1_STAC7|nr:CHAT domain-containing protein [Stanieria cyanosphaera]AFZ38306.1 PDZ/DHR/GLGF domain protein [Stanieria cyanosphaera PCC 7437]
MQKQQFTLNKDVIYQGNQQVQIELKQGTSFAVRQIDSLFKLGLWIFKAENQLIFLPRATLFERLFPLTATYTKLGTAYKIRAEQVLEFEKVFLDGIIQIKDESLIIDGIYSLSTYNEPLQIARIFQKLEPTAFLRDEFEEYGKSKINYSLGADKFLTVVDNKQFDLDINSFPLTKKYRVSLAGSTETEPFNSLVCYLYLNFSREEKKPNSISLLYKITSGLQHGSLKWCCQPIELFVNNDWYSLIETDNANFQLLNINLEYQENLPTTNCTWCSKKENKLEKNVVPVMGTNIAINLIIDGDLVTGNIVASGYYIDSLEPSTYQATIVGEIEKSKQVEELRQSLNSENSNFTGCWLTNVEAIGKITLEQNSNEVRGAYNRVNEVSGGEIIGIAEGNFLEFSWTDREEKGWGYLRSLNRGGTLYGMWGIGNFPFKSQIFIANWKLPINTEIAVQNDEIFLEEFRNLGQELIHQQRFEQGLIILEEVLNLYRHQRHQLDISSQEKSKDLTSEYFSLFFYVLRNNIYLGKYNNLLAHLEHLIEVIQLSGGEQSASILFKERTASIKNDFAKFKQSCHILTEGLEETRFLLNGENEQGKVGIFFDQKNNLGNIINDIAKNSSAELAGILPGDILIEVNEVEVRYIPIKEVYKLLIGESNTKIAITIQRENKTLTFSLIRQPFKVYPLNRRNELVNFYNYFEQNLLALITLTESELNNLKELNFNIVRGKINFLEAWSILRDRLTLLEEKINLNIEELLKLKETIFIDYPSLLEDVTLAIAFLSQLSFNLKNQYHLSKIHYKSNDNINLRELERKIESFLTENPKLSQIETILFRCYLHYFQVVKGFCLTISLQHDFMSRANIVEFFEVNQQKSRLDLFNLASYIETWRSKLVEDLEKIEALEEAQPLFTKIIEISIALGDVKEALIFSEKSRARAFADLLATRFARDISQDLRNFPVNSSEINFEQIQQLAQTYSATIVEYFVVDRGEIESKVYIWVIQPNGSIFLETIELNYNLQQQINGLDRFLEEAKSSHHLGSSTELAKSQTLLTELARLLIKPIEHFLNTSSANKIILIPHKSLFKIPFANLFNSKSDRYLIEQYSIILSPSIQTLNLTQQNFVNNSDTQNVLVVGNPQMPSFKTLPYAEYAAKAISNLFKTKPLLGKQATKKEILTQLPQAKIIHFGTHAEFNDLQPLEGGIALASEGEEKGFLTVGEILARFAPPQTLSLNAELVVLSACSTGRGKITGDGVIGLARGLMAAGVKAVLVSLWEVRDLPTACLMLQFYKYLKLGNTPSDALKQAQVWLKNITNKELWKWLCQENLSVNSIDKEKLKNQLYPFRHPYYWGAFYLIGS